MNRSIISAMPLVPTQKQLFRSMSKAFTTASGVTHTLAMFRLRCLLKISTNNNRRLKK
jgi:hypothetical protein